MKSLLILALWSLICLPVMAKQPAIGNKAIDFSLKRADGDVVTLSELRGKVVLLDFWASWCAPCREEMPMLDILQQAYGRAGFEVLAVNIDNEAKNAREFLSKHRVKLKPLWDSRKEVVGAYDVEKMPTSFIIDQRGWIRFINSGFQAENFQDYKRQIEMLLNESRRGRSRPRNG